MDAICSCARGRSLWYRVRHVRIEVGPGEELRLLEQRTAEASIHRVGRVWSVELAANKASNGGDQESAIVPST